MMQLNIYVSPEKSGVLRRLDEVSRRTGRSKNSLVLAALETYLSQERPALETFHLGVVTIPPRDELYLERGEPEANEGRAGERGGGAR